MVKDKKVRQQKILKNAISFNSPKLNKNDLYEVLNLSGELKNYLLPTMNKYIKSNRTWRNIYEIRITMERRSLNKWDIDCLEFKSGRSKFIVNNKLNNTFTAILYEALKKFMPIGFNYKRITNEISDLCTCTCSILDKVQEGLNKLSISISIDENIRLWLIEVKEFDESKEIKLLDYNIYVRSQYNSFLYTPYFALL